MTRETSKSSKVDKPHGARTAPDDPLDAELLQLIEDMGCLCGIPGCKGHEDMGGYTVIPKLVADLLFEREES